MKRIVLDGSWTLYRVGEESASVTHPNALKDSPSIPAQVPGNVELDLEQIGELAKPFFGLNIKQLHELELDDWWYQQEFETPPDAVGRRTELVFHGVDCLATYWLNGEELGQSDNMFIEHRFDVTDQLNPAGPNILTVRLASPLRAACDKQYGPLLSAQATNWASLWIRKAPHSYGWDIMPKALSAGLWRSVELCIHEPEEIADVYFYTFEAREACAQVGLYYELSLQPERMRGLRLRVTGTCGDSRFVEEQTAHFLAGSLRFEVPDPCLWWPSGYGAAALYALTIELLDGKEVLDVKTIPAGIRKVELIRTETTHHDAPGEFLFKVNGEPIMCKGTNWVPLDAFHSRDTAWCADTLDLCRDLGCNMIRCWGGNVYEDHEFFDLCDRAGIMVWQDFAMACAAYPQAEVFHEAMRREGRSVIRKLRNHPSLTLWCGDNECDYNYPDPATNRLTRETLAQVVAENDPHRPYMPSSPYWAPEVAQSGDLNLMPERHLWSPRDYYKSRAYVDCPAHFIGEIGYFGCPNVSTIRQFIDAEHLWPWQDNPHWIAHATDPEFGAGPKAMRLQLMADQIRELFGDCPENLEEFVLASQIAQAEALKFFIESTRLKKWRRTGILWWNVRDGWPQFSDAIVDYYFGKKLAYHYVKRAQPPVCVMIAEPDDWHVRVVAGNDSRADKAGSYRVRDADTGEVVLQGDFSATANGNMDLGKIRVSRSDHRLFLIDWTCAAGEFGNHYLLGYPPHDFRKYRTWLKSIAAMPTPFDADAVGR